MANSMRQVRSDARNEVRRHGRKPRATPASRAVIDRQKESKQLNRALAGDRAKGIAEKIEWSVNLRNRWWTFSPPHMPILPLPMDRVSDKELSQAKIQAVQAMQEFGVLVECSRASGIGRYQLERLIYASMEAAEYDEAFSAAMKKARRECHERLEGAFIQRGMMRGGDLAGIFYQKHNRLKYREIQRVELTGKDGVPFNQMDAMKVELIQRLVKLRGSAGSAGSVGSGSAGSGGSGEIVIEKAAGSAGSPAGSGPKLVGSGKPRRRREA